MSKKVIKRKASDSTYYHKDFHIALNYGLDYLYKKYGETAVKEYLGQFTKSYYAPLTAEMNERGLTAVKEHYEKIFEIEGAQYEISQTQDELILHLYSSPAVEHIKKTGHPLSAVFRETVITTMRVLCENSPYYVDILEYNEQDGGYRVRFYRRSS